MAIHPGEVRREHNRYISLPKGDGLLKEGALKRIIGAIAFSSPNSGSSRESSPHLRRVSGKCGLGVADPRLLLPLPELIATAPPRKNHGRPSEKRMLARGKRDEPASPERQSSDPYSPRGDTTPRTPRPMPTRRGSTNSQCHAYIPSITATARRHRTPPLPFLAQPTSLLKALQAMLDLREKTATLLVALRIKLAGHATNGSPTPKSVKNTSI